MPSYFFISTGCVDYNCIGEKEISPKVLKITPKELIITFGVIDVDDILREYPEVSLRL